MKKILSLIIVLTLSAICLFGCNSMPKHFTGEWKFSQISKVELSTELSTFEIEMLKEAYGVDSEEGIINSRLAQFAEEETFANYYLKFGKEYTYTYDPLFDREVTWAFYQTSENKGFISYDTQLDASAGNPAPEVFPEISYNPDTDTMVIVEPYSSYYIVTLELKR